MSDKPPIPTSGKRIFKDISETESATHVYIKVDNPLSLSPKFEGPYKIVSRPSRSQVEVKLGLYADGSLRTQVYHWSSCKVAAMRDSGHEAARPKLGRPPKVEPTSLPPGIISILPESGHTSGSEADSIDTNNIQAQIQDGGPNNSVVPPVASSTGGSNSNVPAKSVNPSTGSANAAESAIPSAGSSNSNVPAKILPRRTTRNSNPTYK